MRNSRWWWIALASIVSPLLTNPSRAANYFWNTATSGDWVSTNWSTPTNGPTYTSNWADGNTANFTTGGQLIALNSDVSAAGINFAASGIFITNGSGSLALTGSVSVSSVFTASISGIIGDGTGTTALTKIGTGTLILNGTNTYTGGTTISGGMLQFGNGAVTGSATGNILNNALLRFNNPTASTVSGDITGTGGLIVIGGGIQTFTGTNGYTGTTTLSSAGKAYVASGATLADSSAGAVTVGPAATLGGEGTIGGSSVTFQSTTILDVGDGTADDIGTLTFSNALNFEAGATTTFQFDRSAGDTAGVGFDRVNVGGAITLGGSFTAAIADNTGTNSFTNMTLFSGASRTGTFSNLAEGAFVPGLAGFGGSSQWAINYTAMGVNLVPVPEPMTIFGVAAVGLVLAHWRRRLGKKAEGIV